MSNIKGKTGFTLMEIMTIIVILGAIAGLAIQKYSVLMRNQKESRALLDLRTIRASLEIYKAQNGKYPTTGLSTYVQIDWINSTLGLAIVENAGYYFRYWEEVYPGEGYIATATEIRSPMYRVLWANDPGNVAGSCGDICCNASGDICVTVPMCGP